MRPRLTGLPHLADHATRLGGLPHISCKHNQIKIRNYTERRVTPPRQITSPTWYPPPPCKQTLKVETHDATNRGDVAATNRLIWHVKIIVAATYRSNKISASSLVALCVRICDKSLQQNLNQPMRKHQLVSRHVKFELVYISSLRKSITCTEQASYRSDLSHDQCRRGDLSPRCVASCVSALKQLCNHKVWDFSMAFWVQKHFRTSKKWAPGELNGMPNYGNE